MKILTSFAVLSLVSLVLAAPTSNEDDEKVVITKSMYPKEFVKYTSQHEIVNLLLPINSVNFDENSSESDSSSDEIDTNVILFFVEADFDADGKRIDQGLYSLINGTATKLLQHGRDAAASIDESKDVFFGASDGIYIYNKEKNSAEKYGTIDDSIIGIAKEGTNDVIYILTEDNDVFKVTDKGTKKEKLEDVVKAKQIILDYDNNLFFYSDDKQAYVRTAGGIKKIEGLPENPSSVTLIKPPFILETGVPFIVDTVAYIISPEGKSEHSGFEFKPKAKPTAYAPEAALIQYYAYDKKIYEYNLLAMVLGEILDELKTYLNDKSDDIRSMASKKKSFHKRA